MTESDKVKPISILEYEVLGKLPDPFVFEDGGRVEDASDWEKRREEIKKYAIDLQYGTQPPKPEVFDVEYLYKSPGSYSLKITAGTKERQISYLSKLLMPSSSRYADLKSGKPPVIITGDMCFNYALDKAFISEALDKGVALMLFDRTEIAHDICGEGRGRGALYGVYPEYTFGALGAWAWGYSRCVDALIKLGLTDNDLIVFTGHSRGGKTAMLAGALDERARIVNPNETCAGACGCYRIHMKGQNGAHVQRSETLKDLYGVFPFWIGEGMANYTEDEASLPFDAHFLKALVAPRILLVGEAESDMWSNPVGSWQTSLAAAEVFDMLGVRDRLVWYFREGGHAHSPYDMNMLVSVIERETRGRPLDGRFFVTPFEEPELIFDFKSPRR